MPYKYRQLLVRSRPVPNRTDWAPATDPFPVVPGWKVTALAGCAVSNACEVTVRAPGGKILAIERTSIKFAMAKSHGAETKAVREKYGSTDDRTVKRRSMVET